MQEHATFTKHIEDKCFLVLERNNLSVLSFITNSNNSKIIPYFFSQLLEALNMAEQPIDTNCMTMTRFFLAEQRKYPTAKGDLTNLLTSIQSAVKAISAAVRRAGIAKLFGVEGSTNVQGEQVRNYGFKRSRLNFIDL